MIHDPQGLEGPAGSALGLGLLEIETVLESTKTVRNVEAVHAPSATPMTGYEIHLGRTEGADCARPFAMIDGRPDGAISADGRVAGTYLHGCFTSDAFRGAFLRSLGASVGSLAFDQTVESTLDDLGRHLEAHLDLDRILALAARRV
jgi:adenosylcobyric acid synthase